MSSYTENSSVLEDVVLPIVDFSVGRVKDGSNLDLKFYKSTDLNVRRKRKKLVCESDLEHIGSNFQYDPSREHTRQYLVIVDRESGKKRIYPTEDFTLYPVVKREEDVDSDTERREAMKKVEDASKLKTFHDKLDDLTDAFGSKVKKRSMLARQQNKTSDMTDNMEKSVKKLIESQGMPAQKIQDDCLSVLPYDKDAAAPELVYALDIFFPPAIRSSVVEAAEQLYDLTVEQSKTWKSERNPLGCRYIAHKVMHMHPSIKNDDDIKREYFSCLQILAYLMKFYDNRGGTTSEKSSYFNGISEQWRDWFGKTFVPDSGKLFLRRFSPQVKDKILAYAVILAWHIDTFRFDIEILSEGFGLTRTKISAVVKALGGRVRPTAQGELKKWFACLELPLEFPKRGKQRQSRR